MLQYLGKLQLLVTPQVRYRKNLKNYSSTKLLSVKVVEDLLHMW